MLVPAVVLAEPMPSQYPVELLYAGITLSVTVSAIFLSRTLVMLVLAVWRHAFRVRPNPDEDGLQAYVPLCQCGYDLRWSPLRCPECGRDLKRLDQWMVKSVMTLRTGYHNLRPLDAVDPAQPSPPSKG